MHDDDGAEDDSKGQPRVDLTGPLQRIVALMVGLWAALIVGVLGGLFEALRRALGGAPRDDEER